jgi:hypothetical protein
MLGVAVLYGSKGDFRRMGKRDENLAWRPRISAAAVGHRAYEVLVAECRRRGMRETDVIRMIIEEWAEKNEPMLRSSGFLKVLV